MTTSMIIKRTTHWMKRDPEMMGDYTSIDISVNGIIVQTFGNYYDDKGHIAADAWELGFVAAQGVMYALDPPAEPFELEVDWEYEDVCDYED